MYNIKKAKWIWANETKDKPNQYCQFIQEINIKKVSKEVKIYISATSDYVLYINGDESVLLYYLHFAVQFIQAYCTKMPQLCILLL